MVLRKHVEHHNFLSVNIKFYVLKIKTQLFGFFVCYNMLEVNIMNMEFVNICYKFINRFIVVDQLIDLLTEFNKKYNIKEVESLLENIKELSNKFPNTKDDYVNKEKDD